MKWKIAGRTQGHTCQGRRSSSSPNNPPGWWSGRETAEEDNAVAEFCSRHQMPIISLTEKLLSTSVCDALAAVCQIVKNANSDQSKPLPLRLGQGLTVWDYDEVIKNADRKVLRTHYYVPVVLEMHATSSRSKIPLLKRWDYFATFFSDLALN